MSFIVYRCPISYSYLEASHFEKTFSVFDLRKADTIYALVSMGTIVNIFALRYSIEIRQ